MATALKIRANTARVLFIEGYCDIPAGATDFRLRRDLVEILANFVEFQFATYRLLGAGNPNATQ
jgi:hypothetical protein